MFRRTSVFRRAGFAVLLAGGLGAHAAPAGVVPYPNTSGFGVDFDSSEDWHRQCMRVAHPSPLPATASAGRTQACKADLYYLTRDRAATSPAEWRQVRECALADGDDAVLMMLYANGYGLARDTDRAIYHACRLDTAKAEMEARVDHLASAGAALDDQPFDLCDHITSGRMGAVCAAIGERRDERVRRARLDRFAAALPAAAREPFARLRQAAAVFARKSANETDMTGTGGAGFALRQAGRRDEEFMETLFGAASGKIGRASAAQLARLDRQLKLQYRRVLATPSAQADQPERIGYSTVTRNDVRATEQAWLAYRKAWAAYLAAARSPADLASVRAQLTRQRIAQLKRL